MSLTAFAIGLYAVVVVGFAVAWFVTDSELLSRYEELTGKRVSHGSRFVRFAQNPIGAVRDVPAFLDVAHDARFGSADPVRSAYVLGGLDY